MPQAPANSVTSASSLAARPRDRSLSRTHRSTTPNVRTTWRPTRTIRNSAPIWAARTPFATAT